MSTSSRRSIWSLIVVETLCLLGEEVSRFGISVWIYLSTHSVSAFSWLMIANVVPGMLARPVAGSIVDRRSRKAVMIGSSVLALVGTGTVFAGAIIGELSMPIVLIGASIASIAEAFQWPALEASVPLMASEEDLPAYNGFMESGRAIGRFAGPAIGAFAIAFIGVSGLVAIEGVTFVISTFVIASIQIPNPTQDEDDEGSLWDDAQLGFRWIFAHAPLLKFLLVATFANFFLAIAEVVMQPYGLSFLSERSYGIGNAMFGVGMIVGGIACGMLAKRLTNLQQFFGAAALIGITFGAFGFTRGAVGFAALNFMVAAMITIVNASAMTIWQTRTPEELQGRVFSAMGVLADITTPISFALAAPITEQLVPALYTRVHGDAVWGTPPTGEMGAVFTLIGVLILVGVAVTWTVRDIRTLDEPGEADEADEADGGGEADEAEVG